MADPRKIVNFDGIDAVYATFKIDNSTITYDSTKTDGTASVGLAVTLSADGTVALTAAGDAVIGKLISVEADNFATVQIGGICTLPGGSGATLTRGEKIMGALGAASAKGYIDSVPSAGAAYVQADQQKIARGRGVILDKSDTTAVVVQLD